MANFKKNLIRNKRGAGLRPFVIALAVVILLSFTLLNFVGTFIRTTNPSSEVFNSQYGLNSSINRLNNTLSDFSDVGNSVYSQLGESEPSATDYLFLVFKGAFYIPLAFLGFVITGISSLTAILFPTLSGTGAGNILSIVLGVISSALIITIVLLIIKSVRSGESER
jgi:hypothetical protein